MEENIKFKTVDAAASGIAMLSAAVALAGAAAVSVPVMEAAMVAGAFAAAGKLFASIGGGANPRTRPPQVNAEGVDDAMRVIKTPR